MILLVVAGVAGLSVSFDRSRAHSLFESDLNHSSFVVGEFLRHLPATDKRIDPTNGEEFALHLPYDPGLPGYALFAKYTSHVGPPAVNSNVGAPHTEFGGWQALNLPEEKLKKLGEVWLHRINAMPQGEVRWRMPNGLPYAWGGEPTGMGARVCFTIAGAAGSQGWEWVFVDHCVIKDDVIDLLNDCLKEIGETAVPLNVPMGIDWMPTTSRPTTCPAVWPTAGFTRFRLPIPTRWG